jgi:hypothetical protein
MALPISELVMQAMGTE